MVILVIKMQYAYQIFTASIEIASEVFTPEL